MTILELNAVTETLQLKEREWAANMNSLTQQLFFLQREKEEQSKEVQILREEIERLQAVRTAEKMQTKSEEDNVSLLTVLWQLYHFFI